jgi:hypothetical protein
MIAEIVTYYPLTTISANPSPSSSYNTPKDVVH